MLYVLGYPSDIGGANVELFATVRLWRSHGVDVTLIPTWAANGQWRERLDGIGCQTLVASAETLELPPDSTLVSFANYHLYDVADKLRDHGCRIISVPCVAEPDQHTLKFHEAGGWCDICVFQSRYQLDQFAAVTSRIQTEFHLIPGAFDPADFPFNPLPHKPGEPFVCGRISRPDVRKFSPDLWDAYRGVPNIQARIMGWSGPVEAHCGKPPEWATVLRKRTEPAREFYGKLPATIHPGGEADETEPRFVLEAMAAGVPVISDNRGGTREMIEDGVTGCLCATLAEMSLRAQYLENNERHRHHVAERARAAVARLSDPDVIWAKWEPLIRGCHA